MKLSVVIFWLHILSLPISLAAQADSTWYTLEEARLVNPDSVFRLDLSRSKLREIPNEIYQYHNVRELNLAQNKLQNLPDTFFFPNLQILNIEKNELDTFSSAICKHSELRQLYLGKNDIRYVPDCIANLKNLERLDMWFNPIADLNPAMAELRKLKYLDLRGITYSNTFQKKWSSLLPWVKIEFDLGCDCAD